jgi:hypothetical protein
MRPNIIVFCQWQNYFFVRKDLAAATILGALPMKIWSLNIITGRFKKVYSFRIYFL